MQSIQKELPGLINALLQSPADRQRALVEKHYAPDCRLTHALMIAENREEIVRTFQYWRFVNRHLAAHIHELVLDSSEGAAKVWVQFTQRIEGFNHLPFVSLDLAMSTLLYLKATSQGWIITKQVDYHSFESVLYTMPGVGWVMERGFRRLTTAAMMGTAKAAGALWPAADRVLAGAPWVGGARWKRIKAAAPGWWWADSEQYKGRTTAPYRPYL